MWLLGRSGQVSGQEVALWRLWQSGACVAAKRCDIASREEAFSLAGGEYPLCGLMHAGGVLQDATVQNMNIARCRAVFAPKVTGLNNVEHMLGISAMDAVVLFSSISSLLGGVGQANYTAANAVLDAAAALRQGKGSAGASIQWGAWSGSGMAARDASTLQRAERVGIGVVTPAMGLAVMALVLKVGREAGVSERMFQVGVASPFVWSTFMKQMGNPGIYSEFQQVQQLRQATDERCTLRRVAKPLKKPNYQNTPKKVSDEQKMAMKSHVTNTVTAVLGSAVGSDEPLMDAGLDSLGAVELRNGLTRSMGMELPGTLVFDYPSLGALQGFFEAQLTPTDEGEDGDELEEELLTGVSARRSTKKKTKKKKSATDYIQEHSIASTPPN